MIPVPVRESSQRRSTVPSREADAASPVAAEEDEINLLLVDDTPDKLLALESVLLQLCPRVVKAKSGREALRLILQHDFAVILLDINMPGMDGFETASFIRQRQQSAHIPIIFVTAFSTGEADVYRGYSLGAVDYLFTPVTPEVLRSKVSVFIDLARKNRQILRQSAALRQAEEETFNRRLQETNNRLEWETRRNHFFRLSIELLAIASYEGVFSQTNPTWGKSLGHTEESLQGRSLLDFVHPEDLVSTRETLANITRAETSLYFESRFRSALGEYRWLGWTIAPFAAEGLLYIFARDITERREREEKIRALNDDLKRHALTLQNVNQELESFSYSIAHDLRTPLLAINGYSELLMADELNRLGTDSAQMLKAINRSSAHMSQLIDDFLGFFRFSRQEIVPGYVDMAAVVREAISSVQPITEKRSIDFVIGDLPSATGDSVMVRQVLINLLSNAVKFTGRRENARIEVGHLPDERPPVYYVRDNGVGFNMKYYKKLFGVFERLHTLDEFEGTGIGLAIVQKVVQRHGGRVWADSEVNQGATFYFTLAKG